jgi:pimeloyl-ACP methyl ester carboxylesterase
VWDPVLDRLPPAVDARALTLSLFGRANAPGEGGAFGTELHAADIVDFVRSAMEEPVDVVAWSYSVHPVLLAALRSPHSFARLFLYEPGLPTYLADDADRAAFEADASAAFGPIGEALQREGPAAAVAALIDSSGGEGAFAALPAARRQMYLDSASMMPLLMGGGQPPAPIAAADLSNMSIPATVAMGARTRPVFAVPSRALAASLPHARLVVVEGADHMLPETNPARFAEIVAEWLLERPDD